MKKYLLAVLLFSVVLLGCKRNDIAEMDINTITDLTVLQNMIVQISEEMTEGTITMEQAQNLIDQLQQKYVDLTDNAQKTIETQFDAIQKTFDKQSLPSYGLPLRAKKLGMMEPKGMEFNKALSKQTIVDDNGYVSTMLVYTGNYIIAQQQAKLIAQKANLHISTTFAKGQSIAQSGDVRYISGLDIGSLTKGIVYVNHELTDTNIDHLLSVSVDQNGSLTIEATKYKSN